MFVYSVDMSTAATQLDPVTATINRTIRAMQAIRDITPEEFWERAGIARGTYYNRMKGRGDWTAQEVKRAADALNVSVATLYDGLSVAGAGFEPATSGLRVGLGFAFRNGNVRPASRAGHGGRSITCGSRSSTTTGHTSKLRGAGPRRSGHGCLICAVGPGSARTRTRLHV